MKNLFRMPVDTGFLIALYATVCFSPVLADQDPIFLDGLEDPGVTRVTGRVWAPSNAPGDVPQGEEIPVFNALIRITPSRPPGIAPFVHCMDCADEASDGVHSNHTGHFSILAEPGEAWLSIRKGFFEIHRQIEIMPGLNTLDVSLTTLPSQTNIPAGDYTPKIALAIGEYDPFQTILAKLGFGAVNETGAYVEGSFDGYYDIWSNGGTEPGATMNLASLVSNLATMSQYHVIVIPSAGSNSVAALQSQANLKNIRDWVSLGGWLVVSEWSGEWNDNVFPSRLTLKEGDTPGVAYDLATDTWNTALFGDANGSSHGSQISEVNDASLAAWLDAQAGPTVSSSATTDFDPYSVAVPDIWGSITALGSASLNETIVDIPKAWMVADYDQRFQVPTIVSHRQGACGRVWYSTAKMSMVNAHIGLIAHERLSVFGLMEAGRCVIPAD